MDWKWFANRQREHERQAANEKAEQDRRRAESQRNARFASAAPSRSEPADTSMMDYALGVAGVPVASPMGLSGYMQHIALQPAPEPTRHESHHTAPSTGHSSSSSYSSGSDYGSSSSSYDSGSSSSDSGSSSSGSGE